MPQKFRQRGKKKQKDQQQFQEPDAGWGWRGQEVGEAEEGVGAKIDGDYVPLDPSTTTTGAVQGEAEASTSGQEQEGEPNHVPIDMGWEADGRHVPLDVAPFGFVPPDLKTYLKDIQSQLFALPLPSSSSHSTRAGSSYHDSNAEQDDADASQGNLLRIAVLREMDGQELTVATDGDTSVVLEKLIEGLDAKRVRILGDRMAGSCALLATHRFGSHILQSLLLALRRDVISTTSLRSRAQTSASTSKSSGVLRSASDLILAIASELTPVAGEMLQSTFATYVLRTLLLVLAGKDPSEGIGRSKKSQTFRSRLEANAAEENGHTGPSIRRDINGATNQSFAVPEGWHEALSQLREACVPKDTLGRNEARALLVSPSASPTFALLLSLEAEAREAARPESLSDVVLEGLVSEALSGKETMESTDGLETLLRHPSGSHSLEAILASPALPNTVTKLFWCTYVERKLLRLAVHPVANFVVAKIVKRLDEETLKQTIDIVIEGEGGKMVKEKKIGVLLALVERSAALQRKRDTDLQEPPTTAPSLHHRALEAILATFGFSSAEMKEQEGAGTFVKAVLAIQTQQGWNKLQKRKEKHSAKGRKGGAKATREAQDNAAASDGEVANGKKRKRDNPDDGDAEADVDKLKADEATMQGSLLLQTLDRLGSPWNDVVINGLLSLSVALYSTNPISSHVYLTTLSLPSPALLPYPVLRRLLTHLTPHLFTLSNDKYGSRIADKLWLRSDAFLREKIIKEQLLSRNGTAEATESDWNASFYGRFFLKKANLQLWRRDIGKWKDWCREDRKKIVEEGREELVKPLGEEEEEGESAAVDGSVVGEIDGEVFTNGGKRQKKKVKQVSKEQSELDDIFANV